jgi:alkaline phosphatase D
MSRAFLLLLFFVSAAVAQPPISRIGFGSCASQERPQPIWDAVLAQGPELFILLGANIYADTDNPAILKQKYDQLGAVPGFQRLRAACPLLAIWGDHDFGTNAAGAENQNKDVSQRLFLEFFREPSESPRWKRPGLYGGAIFGPDGKRVQVILLDTRYHRSPLKMKGQEFVPDSDPSRTFLGVEQWKWLEEQFRIPAEVRLICSSIQVVADEHPYEKWVNFPKERDRLFKLLRDTKAAGVIFLSGDRRLGELSQMDAGIGYPVYDLTSSGLNMGNQRWKGVEKNSKRVATMTYGDNFGMVQIDWDKPDPQIRLQVRDVEGEIKINEKVDLSLLKPGTTKIIAAAPTPTPEPTEKPAADSAITPAEAAKKVGEKVTVEFVVANTGKTRDGFRVFLNSSSLRDANNFTIVLDMRKLEDALKQVDIANPTEHYKNKTVRVTGTVSTFRDAPQIVVEDMKQVEVVK